MIELSRAEVQDGLRSVAISCGRKARLEGRSEPTAGEMVINNGWLRDVPFFIHIYLPWSISDCQKSGRDNWPSEILLPFIKHIDGLLKNDTATDWEIHLAREALISSYGKRPYFFLEMLRQGKEPDEISYEDLTLWMHGPDPHRASREQAVRIYGHEGMACTRCPAHLAPKGGWFT